MLPILNLRDYLHRPWRFTRRIMHHRTKQVATIDGTVTWQTLPGTEAETAQLYHEQGVIHFGSYTGKATQAYRYCFVETSRADIYFRDGRFFYILDLTTGHCDMRHPCGDDTYDGRVEVISATQYQQRWQVTGPRNHYTSETTFFCTSNQPEERS